MLSRFEKKTFKQIPACLPKFDDFHLIGKIVGDFKSKFCKYLIEGVQVFMERENTRSLNFKTKWNDKLELWAIACLLQMYGVIYFVSRHEIKRIKELASENQQALLEIEKIVNKDDNYIGIVNYAAGSFFNNEIDCIVDAPFDLPPYGFFFKSRTHAYVQKKSMNLNPRELLDCKKPLFDLHDFSHYVCQLLNDTFYGCKLFDSFLLLPENMKELILEQDYQKTTNPFTDNLIFRNISLVLYNTIQKENLSEKQIVSNISSKLIDYFNGKPICAGNSFFNAKRKLSIQELIVLAEHKTYEYAASEMEEHLFVRGGTDSVFNPLDKVSLMERIDIIYKQEMFYYEKRNYLRHRSIAHAYKEFTEQLKSSIKEPTATNLLDRLNFNNPLTSKRTIFQEMLELKTVLK